MRKIHPVLLVIISTCLVLAACSSTPFQDQDPGWVLMRYATNEEKGIFTLEPVDIGEEAEIVQDVFPGTMDEMRTEILKSITSEELPESGGTYQGSTLTWEWYQEETQIPEYARKIALNPEAGELDAAMAEEILRFAVA